MFHRFRSLFGALLFASLFFFFHQAVLCAAEQDVIKPGDKVGVQFTCRFPNGEIAASTSTAVAKDTSLRKSAVYVPRSKDDPLEVTAGPNVAAKRFPVPFLDEIVARIAASLPGMTPGKTQTIEIRSERPTDVPEKEQFLELSRIRQWPKEIRMTRDEFKIRAGKDAEAGAECSLDPIMPGKVVSVTENEVLVQPAAKAGSEVETPLGKAIVHENGDKIEAVIEADKGTLVRMGPVVGRISDTKEETFTIDFGNPFGGGPLTCEVKAERIVDKNKPSKQK
jgi:FKBP-type peptidyl-prolyl cis-trans isomerase 2